MNHLYEDNLGVLHACEKSEIHPKHVGNDGITLVWTKCEIDVPANKSFESDERVTCEKCKASK